MFLEDGDKESEGNGGNFKKKKKSISNERCTKNAGGFSKREEEETPVAGWTKPCGGLGGETMSAGSA